MIPLQPVPLCRYTGGPFPSGGHAPSQGNISVASSRPTLPSFRSGSRGSVDPLHSANHSDRYTGVPYQQADMRISLGELPLMEAGQPLDFDAAAASKYLTEQTSKHGTVEIRVSIGARALAWNRRVSCEFGGTADCCGRRQIGVQPGAEADSQLILLLTP